jgi:hypothetical protein
LIDGSKVWMAKVKKVSWYLGGVGLLENGLKIAWKVSPLTKPGRLALWWSLGRNGAY